MDALVPSCPTCPLDEPSQNGPADRSRGCGCGRRRRKCPEAGNGGWELPSDMTKSSDITVMDAVSLSRAIHSRRVSCVEVMNATLDHIEVINPKVNAIVSLQDRGVLVAEAKARDDELAS